jgi:hypothetical protein
MTEMTAMATAAAVATARARAGPSVLVDRRWQLCGGALCALPSDNSAPALPSEERLPSTGRENDLALLC